MVHQHALLDSLHWSSYLSWHDIALFFLASPLALYQSHVIGNMAKIYQKFCQFILRRMVDRANLIWNISNPCCFIFMAWLTVPGISVNKVALQ